MTPAPPLRRGRFWVWAAVGAGLLFLVLANVHLVYVAVTTQPDCVAHTRDGASAAAKSSCRSE